MIRPLLIVVIVLASTRAAESLTICRTAPDWNLAPKWSWYQIEGQRCWWAGKPRSLRREELYWPEPEAQSHAEAPPIDVDVPELGPVLIYPEAPAWVLEYRWPQGVK